jgi:hypothetical protein
MLFGGKVSVETLQTVTCFERVPVDALPSIFIVSDVTLKDEVSTNARTWSYADQELTLGELHCRRTLYRTYCQEKQRERQLKFASSPQPVRNAPGAGNGLHHIPVKMA